MNKLSNTQKIVMCYLGLVVLLLLTGNSNNVPEIFSERIFKPISGSNGGTFYYSTLIVTVGIYFCLKQLNKIRETSIIKTFGRRVIVIMVLTSVFNSSWDYAIKLYKGASSNLNSVYLDRDKTLVKFNENDNIITVNGNIDIINCSKSTQKFYIKIRVPSLVKEDINEFYVTLQNEYIVNGKEEKTLNISEELKVNRENKISGYEFNAFEYILFNENDKVVFKGTSGDYRMDKWDSDHF